MFNSNAHTPSCQAATLDNNLSHMPFNLTDPLFESFSAKIKPCSKFDLNLHVYDFDSNASFLIILSNSFIPRVTISCFFLRFVLIFKHNV